MTHSHIPRIEALAGLGLALALTVSGCVGDVRAQSASLGDELHRPGEPPTFPVTDGGAIDGGGADASAPRFRPSEARVDAPARDGQPGLPAPERRVEITPDVRIPASRASSPGPGPDPCEAEIR